MTEVKFKVGTRVSSTRHTGKVIGIINTEPERIYLVENRRQIRDLLLESELRATNNKKKEILWTEKNWLS